MSIIGRAPAGNRAADWPACLHRVPYRRLARKPIEKYKISRYIGLESSRTAVDGPNEICEILPAPSTIYSSSRLASYGIQVEKRRPLYNSLYAVAMEYH